MACILDDSVKEVLKRLPAGISKAINKSALEAYVREQIQLKTKANLTSKLETMKPTIEQSDQKKTESTNQPDKGELNTHVSMPKVSAEYAKFAKAVVDKIIAEVKPLFKGDKQLAVKILRGDNVHYGEYAPGSKTVIMPDFDALINGIDDKGNVSTDILSEVNAVLKGNKAIKGALGVKAAAIANRESLVYETTKTHEYLHAGTVELINSKPNDPDVIEIKNTYSKLKKFAKTNPDHAINKSSDNETNNDYWRIDPTTGKERTSPAEFVAVLFSEPKFAEALSTIDAEVLRDTKDPVMSVMTKIAESILNLFGLKDKNNVGQLMSSVMRIVGKTKPREDVKTVKPSQTKETTNKAPKTDFNTARPDDKVGIMTQEEIAESEKILNNIAEQHKDC